MSTEVRLDGPLGGGRLWVVVVVEITAVVLDELGAFLALHYIGDRLTSPLLGTGLGVGGKDGPSDKEIARTTNVYGWEGT